jgi:hypothetical protein
MSDPNDERPLKEAPSRPMTVREMTGDWAAREIAT